MKIGAIITGDIVDSTKMSAEERKSMLLMLQSLAHRPKGDKASQSIFDLNPNTLLIPSTGKRDDFRASRPQINYRSYRDNQWQSRSFHNNLGLSFIHLPYKFTDFQRDAEIYHVSFAQSDGKSDRCV